MPVSALLVEEDISVLLATAELLFTRGYEVLSTANGVDAIRRLQSGSLFDVVITGVRMSECTGIDIVAAARRIRPQMPVVYLTASASTEEAGRLGLNAHTEVVAKPFTFGALEAAIQRVLS